MRIVAILQARMNSTRLPGKMLLDLAGAPLVQRVIERVRRAAKLDFVVLAYPLQDNPNFKSILNSFADTPGVPLGSWAGQGDENDLIQRYLGAARAYDADIIVRIPCDNPCVDPDSIDDAIAEYCNHPYVFYSNTTDYVKTPHFNTSWMAVDGIGCEVFSASRLKWLDTKTHGKAELREHPHKYFLDKYKDNDAPDCGIAIGQLAASLRLDVNTMEEYLFIKDIYDHFNRNDFTASEVVAYLESKKVTA